MNWSKVPMATAQLKQRPKEALNEAIATVESIREKERSRFESGRKTWKYFNTKLHMRKTARFNKRMTVLSVAIDTLREASKLWHA